MERKASTKQLLFFKLFSEKKKHYAKCKLKCSQLESFV